MKRNLMPAAGDGGEDGAPKIQFEAPGAALDRPLKEFGLFRRLVLFVSHQSPRTQGVIAGCLFFAASATCAWLFYLTARDAFRSSTDQNLLAFARVAALRIDPEVHARLTRPEQHDGPEYRLLVEKLRRVVDTVKDVRRIRTIRPTRDGYSFVLDTGHAPGSRADEGLDQITLGTPFDEAPPHLLEFIQTQEYYITPLPSTDRWGTHFSAWVPVRHRDGRLECILGVNLAHDDYNVQCGRMWQALIASWGVSLLASIAIGSSIAFSVRTKRDFVDRLSRSERRYALAVSGSNEGIWDWDLQSDTIYLSDQIKRMIGVEGEIPGGGSIRERFLEVVHPEDRARVEAALQNHLRSHSQYDVEFRMKTEHCGYRWFRSRGEAVWDELGRPVRFVGSFGDVTDRVRLSRQLKRAARLDRLTRLPNRSTLLRRLRRVIRAHRGQQESCYALLFLDFDRFKIVNDSLGHEAGDALLIQIAARLRANLRAGDEVLRAGCSGTAARIGGDEFVVLLEGIRGAEDAVGVANRLLDVLAEPYTIQSYRVISTASIGIVVGDHRYRRADDLLRDADTAMYEAKSSSRGTLAVFDETMRRRVRRRMQLEQGLREAIPNDRLDLVYQPIVCLQTGRLVSVEVLSRWVHPELGPISPEEFVPLAEECGLIVPLGERVISRAFRQLACWKADDPEAIPGISVNLARQHLVVPGLAAWVLAEAEAAGLDPADIHLEITEGAVIQDVPAARRALGELRAAGFRLAIDDFGTGYSSLACLHEYPLDLLKIDRSFVQGLGRSNDQTAIVRTITSLAGILGFRVVAEGIETAQQLAILRELGCEYGQGYSIARPVPADFLGAEDLARTVSQGRELGLAYST